MLLIYTSYFSKIKDLPDSVIPISICGKAPDGYKGLQYKKLAPKYDFFMRWKETHDNEYYIKCFNEQVLHVLNCDDIIKDLLLLVGNFKGLNYLPDICLVCYEKPSDFCHRHLVADWLSKNGYKCEEFIYR